MSTSPSLITDLSAAQWARVAEERERWRAVGTCTEPADRETTERVLSAWYRRLGHEPPTFVWCDGPASCCLIGPLIWALRSGQLGAQLRQFNTQLRDQLGAQLGDQLGARFYAQLYAQLRGQFGQLGAELAATQLRDQLGAELATTQLNVQLNTQLGAELAATQLSAQLNAQLHVQLYDQLCAQLNAQLNAQLRVQLRDQLGAQLGDQLGIQIGVQLNAQLYDQLCAQLYDQPYAQLGVQIGKHVWKLRKWGAEYVRVVARYTVARDVCGVRYTAEQTAQLDEWAALVRSAGWFFPAARVCFLAERHRTLKFDVARRLHCETGPAIECRDGYRVYVWHGTRVPADWIEHREALAPTTALTWENVEQRRAAAEIIGWARVLASLEPRFVDRDPDPEIGELLSIDLPDAPGSRFLRVRCGTGRTFVLPVPAELHTARAANAWTYGLTSDEYNPEVRT